MTRCQVPRKWAANWPAEADVTGKVVKETGTRHVFVPPNGLAFSCGERATTSFPKANDLAREAVGCNAGLGGRAGVLPRSNRSNELHSGSVPRSGVVAQRGGSHSW